MRLTIINVGYGDSLLLETEDGYTALLDGGSALPGEFAGDAYRVRSADYLESRGIRHLDTVLISHIHEDHVCGLEPVFDRCTVDRVYVPYPTAPFLAGRELTPQPDAARSVPLYTAALNAYRRLLLGCRERSIPVSQVVPGDTLDLAPDLTVRVLAPKAESIDAYMALVERAYRSEDGAEVTAALTELDRTSNRTSFLLRIEGGGCVTLAAADSVPSEWSGVPKNLLENVNVLKLPHHGQIDSIDEHLMGKMPLKYVITTSASDRRYNSANPGVYQRLTALFQAEKAPAFLFSDERSYPPYFSQPEGFQAITLVMNSGVITPEFVKI